KTAVMIGGYLVNNGQYFIQLDAYPHSQVKVKLQAIPGRRRGVLISMEAGDSVAYALFNLEDRGKMFIGAGEKVYQGMVIGEHSRDNDLEVNPLKGKKLTNVRASGKDDAVVLTTPVRLSLEEAIAYINDDELVEVTPRSVRLRKRYLDTHERKRQARAAGE
ncbi:MAG: hypothetical protein AAF479_15835, partial [Pseudomonadota bacterium]